MPTTTPLTDAIQALTTYANETTGASDTTLSAAVGTLVAGYGQGGGGDMLPTFVANQNVGSYTFQGNSFTDWQFAEKKFTSLSLPNLVNSQKDNMFYKAEINVLDLPNLQTCRNNYFRESKISTLNVPKLKTCGASAFEGCDQSALNLPEFVNATGQTVFKSMWKLKTAVFPKCTTPGNYSFERCSQLEAVDFTALSTIPQGLFNYCTALNVLVLRNTTAVTLSNVNAFNNMGGKAVTVYVPSALVSTYPTMNNWSSVTAASLTFAAIEGSAYETAYVDGTPIE